MDDTFEISELSEDMSILNVGEAEDLEPTACSCTGACWYKTGKRMCPCKSAGQSCTPRCSCGKRRLCTNREPDDGELSDEDEAVGEPLPKSRRKTTVAQAKQDSHADSVKKFVQELQRADLERVTIQFLCKFPDVYLDARAAAEPNAPQEKPGPSIQPPPFCRCGRCVQMPRDLENVCCRQRVCITTAQFFIDAVINGNVLAASMAASNDLFPRDIPRSNDSYRHYAYKQYTYITHGYLGAGNRRVVPACATTRIRREYPDPVYTGFDGLDN